MKKSYKYEFVRRKQNSLRPSETTETRASSTDTRNRNVNSQMTENIDERAMPLPFFSWTSIINWTAACLLTYNRPRMISTTIKNYRHITKLRKHDIT